LASTSSEDSSSCSGESGRPRPSGGGRLRLGVRMGTRRHGVDYTSSSDQSCDTVIYVGSDDQDLTDHERPPLSTTAASDHVSGGQEDSMARGRGLRRPAGGRHSDGELATSSRLPRRSFSTRPAAWRSPPPPPPPKNSGETWVDGPKSMLTRVEQWVDGPPEFRHTDKENNSVEMTLEQSAGQRLLTIADGDSFLAEVTEETEHQSFVVGKSTMLSDNIVHVASRYDEPTRQQKSTQLSLRSDQSDVTTKISGQQLTVADVHQSASEESGVTDVITSEVHHNAEFDVGENGATSNDGEQIPSVERQKDLGRTKLDIDALLLANRESIYELQMDEELETGSRESLLQLVCGSDDDWSTCGTEPRRSKCQDFRDVDACLKDLDDMVITTSEPPEPKTCGEGEIQTGWQQASKEESAAENNVTSEETKRNVWIRTRDVGESLTNGVVSDCPDNETVPAAASSERESANPTTNKPRHSAIPLPMSSSSSRVRRKPPPVPVRSSSMTQSPDPPRNGRTTTTDVAVTSTSLTKTPCHVVHQKTMSNSKNVSASRGFCSRDCSAAREAEVTTSCTAAAVQTPASGVVTGTPAAEKNAKHPASVPPPSTKSRSRIALPCRRDKKNKHQPEISASDKVTSQSTANQAVPPHPGPLSTPTGEVLTAMTLISPSHSVPKPRLTRGPSSNTSSSAPSSVSRLRTTTGARRRGGTRSEVEASSGYESMIRDSEEVTGTSSASECQSPLRLKANKLFRKKGSLIVLYCFFVLYFNNSCDKRTQYSK